MKKRQLHLKNSLAMLAVASLFGLGQPARAQSAPAQDKDATTVRENDTTRAELGQFDVFLDTHAEIAEQLRRDPSLVNKREFVQTHTALQTFLQQHPAVREELKENPSAFMRQENRYDRATDARDRDTTNREELARFDQFLDSHREISEQLRKDPSLVNKREFVEQHGELQTFLQQHPAVRDQLKDNPSAFMRQENTLDRRDDAADRDARQDAKADERRDDATNRDARQDAKLDERRDDTANRDAKQDARQDDRDRDTHQRFGEFLGGHDDIAKDLSKNPSLAKDHDYVAKHPELRDYLNKNSDVRNDLMKDPDGFVKSAQQFHNNSWTAPKTQTLDPSKTPDATKPKQ
jgi:hypothetical protein